jgi:hypothetical protein
MQSCMEGKKCISISISKFIIISGVLCHWGKFNHYLKGSSDIYLVESVIN